MTGRRILLMAALLALLVPSGAEAASVVNGNFESGTLNGWNVRRATQAGNWFAYSGTNAPIGGKRGADPVQEPPQGLYAAVADQANPDTLILYQDVALEPGRSHRLSLLAYYDSYEPIAVPTPDTLSVEDSVLGGQSNQQYRIDVMRPDAPIESVDPTDILRTLFQTQPDDPESLQPTKLTVDLSPFAGQTVRLRIANTATEEVFNAGVDAVSISSTAPGKSAPGGGKNRGSKIRGSVRFGFGRVKRNRHNGTVTLPVHLPDPGLLTVKDESASTPAPTALASRVRKFRKAIQPVTVKASRAGTMMMRLKPRPSALEILKQKQRLEVEVTVIYEPSVGPREVAALPVVLQLAPQRPHRH